MRSINLIPFHESLIINGKLDFREIIMNAAIFIPLGIYSGILFKKWIIGKRIFLFFLISLTYEVSQFILGVGASDITDIINNMLRMMRQKIAFSHKKGFTLWESA